MSALAIPKEPVIPKVDKLRVAAQHYDCVICGKDKRFTVAAHCNSLSSGRGFAFKAPGYAIAYVCGDPGGCHDLMDGRATIEGQVPKKDLKRVLWNEAHRRTVAIWFRDGWVTVK